MGVRMVRVFITLLVKRDLELLLLGGGITHELRGVSHRVRLNNYSAEIMQTL